MSSLSTSETIQQFQSIFAELGIPRHLHCDRGSNYTSMEFQQFMQGLNVKLSYSSSEHHSSNYAERSVQVVKGFMKRSVEWPICLLEYLMTPIRHQGVDNSPLKLMQKRTIRGLLPVRQQETNIQDYENYHAGKQEQAKYQSGKPLQELPEGSNILFYSERESQWLPGVIVQRLHDRSYIIISEKGRKVVRNRIDVKQYHKDVHVRFQSSYKRSITAPKTSLPSPSTVNKTVQQQPSDTSPQDPLDSSRPNNSNHQNLHYHHRNHLLNHFSYHLQKYHLPPHHHKNPKRTAVYKSSPLVNQNTIKQGLVVIFHHIGKKYIANLM